MARGSGVSAGRAWSAPWLRNVAFRASPYETAKARGAPQLETDQGGRSGDPWTGTDRPEEAAIRCARELPQLARKPQDLVVLAGRAGTTSAWGRPPPEPQRRRRRHQAASTVMPDAASTATAEPRPPQPTRTRRHDHHPNESLAHAQLQEIIDGPIESAPPTTSSRQSTAAAMTGTSDERFARRNAELHRHHGTDGLAQHDGRRPYRSAMWWGCRVVGVDRSAHEHAARGPARVRNPHTPAPGTNSSAVGGARCRRRSAVPSSDAADQEAAARTSARPSPAASPRNRPRPPRWASASRTSPSIPATSTPRFAGNTATRCSVEWSTATTRSKPVARREETPSLAFGPAQQPPGGAPRRSR